MIIKGLFELVYSLLSVVLTPFEIIPDMPQHITNLLNIFHDVIMDAFSLTFFFINPFTVKIAIPLVILIANMEHIWDGIVWILKKLPFVGIE